MSAREARTGAAATAAPDDSKERDVKIPVEAVDENGNVIDDEQVVEEPVGEEVVEATHDDTPEQAAAAFHLARAHGVPLTARGGGTSCASNAIGPGLVLEPSPV